MPLEKSGSKEAREKNIEEMIKAGHDPKQAVAAGYANQRKYSGDAIQIIGDSLRKAKK